MLKDGAKAAAAIKTLNRYMIEKSGREENFSYSRSHDNRQDYGES